MYEHLYMRGSLRNVGDGFGFEVRNLVDSGKATGIHAPSADRRTTDRDMEGDENG
jgi:hypothetical protein